MDKTLLILAAGIGSRYGGVKQLTRIGPSGEVLIDYSIYDAIQAGFNKVVFVVSPEILDDMKEVFEPKLAGKVQVEYAIQDKDGREKPWGTGHAVLCARNVISEPFAAINADDFYGKHSYQAISGFFDHTDPDNTNTYCLVGFHLGNTLSEHGTVSRGVCKVNEDNHLVSIEETTRIRKKDQKIMDESSGRELQPEDIVSMNFWGLGPSIFSHLEELFAQFKSENRDNPKAEFYIPSAVDHLITNNNTKVEVLESREQWLGLTYSEDKPIAEKLIREQIEKGYYNSPLWQ